MARSVLDLLLEIQLIDDRQYEDVLSRATGAGGGHLIQTVCELGYATESSIARALSAELGLQRADLAATPPAPEALELLDAKLCRDRFVLPLALHEGGALLWLAMADPTDADTIGLVGRKLHKRVRPLVAAPTELVRAIARHQAAAPDGGAPAGASPVAGAAPGSGARRAGKSRAQAEAGGEEAVSPLARIAAALGVRVPQIIPRRPKAAPAAAPPGPRADPDDAREAHAAAASASGGELVDDLTPGDVETLQALSASMEKGTLVLRAVADLCVEKGVLTSDELRRKPGT